MSCSDYALDNTGSSENFRARTLEPDARYVCSWPEAAAIRPDRNGLLTGEHRPRIRVQERRPAWPSLTRSRHRLCIAAIETTLAVVRLSVFVLRWSRTPCFQQA